MSWYEVNAMFERLSDKAKKAYSLYDFQSTELLDESGYFGQEFKLRATAGRLKALYAREPWVYATAALIARTLSTIDFLVANRSDDEINKNHPLNENLETGNQLQDEYTLNWAGYLDLGLGGNFFRVMSEDYKQQTQIPVELVNIKLRDNEVERKVKGLIEGIEVAQSYAGLAKNQFFKSEYVIHHKLPNPYTPIYGLSMFIAAARPILLDRHQNEFQLAFYLRGATNSGVIESTEDLTKSRMDRLMRTFEQAFTGKRNWFRQLFLPKGAKWVNAGLTMAEMEHLETLRENRRTLLAVLGIPPSQIGIVEDVNRATAQVQEAAFWRNTIVPLAKFIASGWNNSYLVKEVYKNEVYVLPDFSGIEALEGDWINKGEQGKAVQDFMVINEIRTDILGLKPLKSTDPRGLLFVREIKPKQESPFGDTPTNEPDPGDIGPEEDNSDPVPEPTDEEDKAAFMSQVKANATMAQDRAERQLGKKYHSKLQNYIDAKLKEAARALVKGDDVRGHLEAYLGERATDYVNDAMPVLEDAMERGFTLSHNNVKDFRPVPKAYRFTQEDEEATRVLADRTRDGKRTTLQKRGIERFYGFDDQNTELIMRVIENGHQAGKTNEQIAKDIEDNFGESYGDQAFTIARTETLSAVSEGIAWHHETMKTIVSEVKKQWFHAGDATLLGGTNAEARNPHAKFELEGEVASNHVWVNSETGNHLTHPRSPNGGAADVINCRCTMVSVIPPNATSNAGSILETT
jgi:HK97 family phage portal protein